MNFFAELKRRNVYKVAVAYAVAGWALSQGIAQVFPVFDIPNWAIRLIVLLIIIGLPIALTLAWTFEITPQGIKRTEDVDRAAAAQRPRHRAWIFVVIIAGAMSLGLFFVGRITAPSKQSGANDISSKSIAVLPFVNMSSDKEQDYFSDGLSEELLNQLAQIPQLRVIARTSSFSFKGKEVDVATIARTLNVANVLEGSVRKSANTLRVTAQLVRASDSSHLWSQTYDRDLTDVFKVQDEIAGKVVAALKVTLLPTQELPKAQRTNNPEAYQQYLQGRYYLNRFSIADFEKARAFLERACQLDPSFPLAWAALSRVWVLQTGWSDKLTRAQFDAGLARARDAADRALQLDPNLPEALSARFEIQFTSDFDWKGGAETIKRAKALAPSDPVILKSAGQVAVISGDFAGAVELARQAVALDPVNAEVRAYLANALLHARRRAESRGQEARVAELNPSTPWAFAGGGMAYLFEGKNAAALAAAERETSEFARLVVTAVALWTLGRKREPDAAPATSTQADADVGSFQIPQTYRPR